jgi:Tol biopolymer transport system component
MRHGWNFLSGLLGIAVVVAAAGVLVLALNSRSGAPQALQPTLPPAERPRITDLRMSDTPGGAAVTAFGRSTDVVYAVFGYTGFQDTPVMVRVYDGVGRVVFETTKRHTGSGTQAVAIAAPAGRFGEDFYLTNIYFGPELLQAASVEWTVGQPPTPVPAPTETPWPTAVPPTPWPVPTVTPLPPLPTPEPTLPGPLPPGLKIVYAETDSSVREYATPEALRDHGTTFWIADVNNVSNRRMIAKVRHAPFTPLQAELSPDGSKIAYIDPSRYPANFGDLWVMAIDGTGQMLLDTRLTVMVKPYPFWSPDSTRLVYQKFKPTDEFTGTYELYAAAADGKGVQRLLTSTDWLVPCGWSPTGELLYTRTGVGVEGGIWKLNLTTGRTDQLISLELGAGHPVVSPDGNHAVYTVPKQGPDLKFGLDLVVASLDGEHKETISQAVYDVSANVYFIAIWSPNSEGITAYLPAQAMGQRPELRTFNLATRQWRVQPAVTEASAQDFDLPRSWSPDGRWLLVEHRPTLEYYLVARDGDRVQPVAPGRLVQLVGWLAD